MKKTKIKQIAAFFSLIGFISILNMQKPELSIYIAAISIVIGAILFLIALFLKDKKEEGVS